MIGRDDSENVRVVSSLMVPFILVFGLYVIAHGHYVPGGGFVGGVVLGVGVVVARVVLDRQLGDRVFPPSVALVAMATGMLLFLASALVPLLAGGQLLDYSAVAVGDLPDARMRYLGILVVEFAVGFVVFGGVLTLFDALARDREEG